MVVDLVINKEFKWSYESNPFLFVKIWKWSKSMHVKNVDILNP